MVRIGVIADIHGNRVALDAALDALARDRVDRIVCLGDVASLGPQPAEAIARLREVDCPVVLGNADAELLDPPPLPEGDDARRMAEIDRWCAEQLSEADRAFLASFRPTVEESLPAGATLLACHGSPRSFDEQMLPTTPEPEIAAMLEGVAATIVAAGHTHAAMVRRSGERILLNPGSVGLPFDTIPPAATTRNPPWAEYAVIEAARGELSLTLGRTPFDVDRLRRIALAGGMPHAEWWAEGWA